MTLVDDLQRIADDAVEHHDVPGVVAGIAEAGAASVVVAGGRALGDRAITRDTVFRIASLTKPIVAAAAMVLVDRDVIHLHDPVSRWLPELADPRVLRDPAGPLDSTVPAARPVLVEHLLALRGGLGFTADFSTPLAAALMESLRQGPPAPAAWPRPDAWIAEAARLPLAHQPGEGWTYNTGFDLLGVLLARAAGSSLGAVLVETVLGPLGMTDTGFRLGPEQIARAATAYASGAAGLVAIDAPDGAWAADIPFESGAGGLVSTVDDLLAFGSMLLARGRAGDASVLSAASVTRMLAAGAPSDPDDPFLAGQSWSLGGSVDVVERQPWEVLGRYGWVGGSGTAMYVYPRAKTVAIWLTQRQLDAPEDAVRMVPMLTLAAERSRALAGRISIHSTWERGTWASPAPPRLDG